MNAKSSLIRRFIWMLKRLLRSNGAEPRQQQRRSDRGVFVI